MGSPLSGPFRDVVGLGSWKLSLGTKMKRSIEGSGRSAEWSDREVLQYKHAICGGIGYADRVG